MKTLPDNWKLVAIEDVVLSNEGLRRGPFGGSLKKEVFVEHGYKVYEQGHVIRQDLGTGRYYITPEKFEELKTFAVLPYDFLVTCSGTGTVGQIIRAGTDAEPGIINQALLRIRVNSQVIDGDFFQQQFRSSIIQDAIVENTQGGGVPNLVGLGLFRQIPLYLPPLPEQRAIAAILSTWDEAITLTRRLIEALQQRKRALMDVLLTGHVRFPGFDGEWDEVTLGEFFKEYSTLNRANENLPIMSCSKIYGIVEQSVIFDRRIASEDIRRYKVIQRGDLVYDPMLLWDASIGFVDSVERGVISPAYETFKRKTDDDLSDYFKELFKTHYFKETYKFISQGTNVRRRKAPVDAFLKINFEMPTSTSEQHAIMNVLRAATAYIRLNINLLDHLQAQKRGLMQLLLTGAVRVQGSE